jgi:hypothetical protein
MISPLVVEPLALAHKVVKSVVASTSTNVVSHIDPHANVLYALSSFGSVDGTRVVYSRERGACIDYRVGSLADPRELGPFCKSLVHHSYNLSL